MAPSLRRVVALGMLGFLACFVQPLAGQNAPANAGQQAGQMSQAEVLRRIRDSGMSRQQVRDQLRRLGYSTETSDRYFDMIDRGESPAGPAEEPFLTALEAIGLLSMVESRESFPDSLLIGNDTLRIDRDTTEVVGDSLGVNRVRVRERIFGRDVFARATSEFQPVTNGPVDPGYRVGPGDQLIVILTGNVELAYQLDVSREGAIVIPDVGQVFVNGLTLGDMQTRLQQRMTQVYAGLADGTIHLQVSLGRLRTNQVMLTGEVERPGAYQVSAAATVFNALYQAGGPTQRGSFRHVLVRRRGQLIGEVDIYDYLLGGDTRTDLRLEQGDILFVPVLGPQVEIAGAVRRPAIYEMAPGDGLAQLMSYAGGLESTASIRRIQVDRVLPPTQRRPGVDRVLMDVELDRLISDAPIDVVDGDVVTVFGIGEERRNRVSVLGEVNSPGMYEWRDGADLSEVIARAGGLTDEAYPNRAHVYRLNERDGTRTLVQVPLDAAGAALSLMDRDSVVVLSRADLRNPTYVTIGGFVKEPGRYQLADGMSVADLILSAGGFIRGAYGVEAEVARQADPLVRGAQLSQVHRVPLIASAESPLVVSDVAGSTATYDPIRAARRTAVEAGVADWTSQATSFVLEDGDHVFVRRAPGFEDPKQIAITGEVVLPGTYILQSRQERLSDLILRARGLTPQAFPGGLRLYRDSLLVPTDLEEAMDDRGSREDLVLEAGDSVIVPEYDATVRVVGEVGFASRVLWRQGQGLDYYVRQAGGYLQTADPDRNIIESANGSRATRGGAWLFKGYPDPGPGSTVYVLPKPPPSGSIDVDRLITRAVGVASAIASAVIIWAQLSKP